MDLRTNRRHKTSRRRAGALATPAFVVAVVLLGAAAALSHLGKGWFNINLTKKELFLRKPLGDLSESALAPYRVVRRTVLEPEVVEALGTGEERYISWSLEDTSLEAGNPLRRAVLFVTYYSGGHNLVPHTPDVCYVGGGYAKAQPHENPDLRIPSLGKPNETVPVRICTFQKTAVFGHDKISVVYTFHANGQFTATRSGVRVLISDLSTTYAYFSKVEVSFDGATREQTLLGAARLFDRVLPELIHEHWPDFDAEERRAAASATESAETP